MSNPDALSPSSRTKKKRRPVLWVVMSTAGVGCGLWLANFLHHAYVFTETDDAYLAGHVHLISSRLDGSVVAVLADDDQTVKAGQVLARLDPLASQIAV